MNKISPKLLTTLRGFHEIKLRKMHNNSLKQIFLKSVESVQPQTLIKNSVSISNSHLLVKGRSYTLNKPLYMVGFGKAVLGMAIELERVLGPHLKRAVVTVPKGIFDCINVNEEIRGGGCNSRMKFIEGAENNLPDESAKQGAEEIKKLVEDLGSDDLLIVLISGGGSALLPLPLDTITLDEKLSLIKSLAKRGADIMELNCVRKQISALKGGGLAELGYPCRIISLILSDIIGDPLDFIASGPTTPNTDTPTDAADIIKKYSLYEQTPDSIKLVLEGKNQLAHRVTPILNGEYTHVENYIIGNNRIAAESARQHAESLGFQSAIISTRVSGQVGKLAEIYAQVACSAASVIKNPSRKESLKVLLQSLETDLHVSDDLIRRIINLDFSKKVCLVAAGEPTVVVKGNGLGGRNQQLALEFSVEVNKLGIKSADISFLSCGTDGIDGPTDAAGAIGTLHLVENSLEQNIKPEDYLDNNDSYGFYSTYNGGRNLVKSGHTGTNVMDMHLLIIEPRE